MDMALSFKGYIEQVCYLKILKRNCTIPKPLNDKQNKSYIRIKLKSKFIHNFHN